jgi:hypothetical protein
MGVFMRENLKILCTQVKDESFTQMGTFTRGYGGKVKLMGLGSSFITRMGLCMKEVGRMITKKVKERKFGLMAHCLWGNFVKGRRMDWEPLHGRMEASSMESS